MGSFRAKERGPILCGVECGQFVDHTFFHHEQEDSLIEQSCQRVLSIIRSLYVRQMGLP